MYTVLTGCVKTCVVDFNKLLLFFNNGEPKILVQEAPLGNNNKTI
jgi:hypothetical protein